MNWFTIFLVGLVAGAVASPRTFAHVVVIAIDLFTSDVLFNTDLGLTLSSRAGISARHGKPFWSKVIGAVFLNMNHCEEAIVADSQRAKDALKFLGERCE